MADRIFLENMRILCKVGAKPGERRKAQEVLVDVSLYRDLAPAGRSDQMDRTVNYKSSMARIRELVSGGEFRLIESVAEGVASLCLEEFGVDRVTVRVRKARYSAEPSIGVEIERKKGGK